MDAARLQQLKNQRAVARGMLTRIQHYIEAGEHKINEIQVRFDKLSDIFNRYDTAQSELELSDDTDHSGDRELFENQYYEVEARFHELLHPVVDPPLSRHSSTSSSLSEHNNSPQSLGGSPNIKLPTITLPIYDGETCKWLQFRDTFEALIVNNTALSNMQRLHYLIASLKNEAKDLISNLQITNENFLVAWQLVTQCYNNKRLIAMMHAKHLCQMPQVKKGDASSLRQLINHMSSHMNAIQALSLDVPVQDLMLNHLALVTLDVETQREWELINASQANIPTTAELISFLESRCRALELIQSTQSMKVTTAPSRFSPSTSKVSKPSYSHLATQVQCPLCKGTHGLFQCSKFARMPPRQRHDYAWQIGACYNCLQPFSKSHICSKDACHVCNKRHHTLLHVNTQTASVSHKRVVINHNPSANHQDSAPAEVNTYFSQQ
jgi:hypothetical protein